ncbi:DUF1572 family protein [Priestia koreensis]|uniref:DUF1572 family protein n=1 Tax=Priestia koreensis TaxID=284581 RepID=UPI00203DCAA9|nr:DUF1572 family protein [Priestia koreensis]MCM3005154.1 DUF1572 domain-containing protein [Priestia koreensis]
MSSSQFAAEYIRVVKARFLDMKKTAERAFDQVDDEMIGWSPNEESNSIGIIVKHMSGNMVSRWTDFFHSDGEKPNRDRDDEFEGTITTREELDARWKRGWTVFLNALDGIGEDDLLRPVYIRGEAHTVMEAIERQMYHYSYHVGQIVYAAKQVQKSWTTLTIPKRKK